MADTVVVVVMSSFVLNKVNTIEESVNYLLSVLVFMFQVRSVLLITVRKTVELIRSKCNWDIDLVSSV